MCVLIVYVVKKSLMVKFAVDKLLKFVLLLLSTPVLKSLFIPLLILIATVNFVIQNLYLLLPVHHDEQQSPETHLLCLIMLQLMYHNVSILLLWSCLTHPNSSLWTTPNHSPFISRRHHKHYKPWTPASAGMTNRVLACPQLPLKLQFQT